MRTCSYCNRPGCQWQTCPDRLEDKFGTSSRKYDGEGEVVVDDE